MQVAQSLLSENRARRLSTIQTDQTCVVEAFEPILRQQGIGRSEPRDEREEDGTLAPGGGQTGRTSADVINESEQRGDPGSRAFRREQAGEQGRREFQETREQYREAARQRAERGVENGARRLEKSEGSANRETSNHTCRAAPARDTADADRSCITTSSKSRLSQTSGVDIRTVQQHSANMGQTSATSAAPTASVAFATPRIAGGVSASNWTAAASTGRYAVVAPAAGVQSTAGGRAEPTMVVARLEENSAGVRAKAASKTAFARESEGAERAANLRRIVRVVQQHLRENSAHTVLRLDPPELGSLRLEMNLRGDALTLRIDTSTHLAQRLLQGEVEKLRQGLEAAGIQLERVEVRPPATTPETLEWADGSRSNADDAGRGASADADAEQSRDSKTESPLERPSFEAATECVEFGPAAEPLVNVIA